MALNFGKRIGDLDPATSAASTDEMELSLTGSAGSRRITILNLLLSLLALFGYFAIAAGEDPTKVTSKWYPVGHVMRYGAKVDGTTDDTVCVGYAVSAAAGAGKGRVDVPAGTCVVQNISLPSNVHLRGAGRGITTIKLLPSLLVADVHTVINNQSTYPSGGNSNIVISDLTVDGSYTGGSASPPSSQAIFFSQCTSCHVRNVSVINARRNGVTFEFSKDCTVRDSDFDTCGVNAIYLSGCDYITVDGNGARKNAGSGNGAGLALANCWFCTVVGNQFVEPQVGGNGLTLGHDTEFCVITGNYIENCGVDAVTLSGTQYFASERTGAPSYDGVTLYTFSNCIISGNTFSTALGQNVTAAFIALYGGNNTYSGNSFIGAWGAGLYLSGSSSNIVKGNLFSRCGMGARGSSSPSTVRWGLIVEKLSASYPGDQNVVDGNLFIDTQAVPTMIGLLIGGNATPSNTLLKDNVVLVSTPLTITDATTRVAQIDNVYGATPGAAPSRTWGTAAPTSGTYAVGDRTVNSSPSVGNPKGWICTVAGTPGTHVSEGNL